MRIITSLFPIIMLLCLAIADQGRPNVVGKTWFRMLPWGEVSKIWFFTPSVAITIVGDSRVLRPYTVESNTVTLYSGGQPTDVFQYFAASNVLIRISDEPPAACLFPVTNEGP